MNKVRLILAVIVLFTVVIFETVEFDGNSDEVLDFPILGKMEAHIDLKLGHPKWYVYGLIYSNTLAKRQELLAPYGITVVAPGCQVGGPTYKRDMAYNQTVLKGLPESARSALIKSD